MVHGSRDVASGHTLSIVVQQHVDATDGVGRACVQCGVVALKALTYGTWPQDAVLPCSRLALSELYSPLDLLRQCALFRHEVRVVPELRPVRLLSTDGTGSRGCGSALLASLTSLLPSHGLRLSLGGLGGLSHLTDALRLLAHERGLLRLHHLVVPGLEAGRYLTTTQGVDVRLRGLRLLVAGLTTGRLIELSPRPVGTGLEAIQLPCPLCCGPLQTVALEGRGELGQPLALRLDGVQCLTGLLGLGIDSLALLARQTTLGGGQYLVHQRLPGISVHQILEAHAPLKIVRHTGQTGDLSLVTEQSVYFSG